MSNISVQTRVNMDIQAILEGVSQLDNASLESFANKVNLLVAKRKTPSLSKKETTLLKNINKGIPHAKNNRLFELQKKQRTTSLSPEEEKELFQLIDYVENLEMKRMKNMLSLANLWNITLGQLRVKVGIQVPPPYVW